jgi:transposase-like protein
VHPVGGVDYPRTVVEFDRWFMSEEACLAYLRRVRWPDGFLCPGCGGSKAWATARGLLRCAGCQRQTSAVAGTIFEGTRKPLRMWFQAMWFVTTQKAGGNALGLQRVLGLGSYQTAWSWLHKLRRAMVRPGREKLRGSVEVDETYVGGAEPGLRGRKTVRKAIVVVAAERDGKGIGRIRLGRVFDVKGASLLHFIKDAIEPGSEVHTDGWLGYAGVTELGYSHVVSNLKRSEQLAHELMPRVHRVASLLTRWILGTHQGAIKREHLDYYLDEFTFRFNRRNSRARGLLFYRLIQQATNLSPVTCRQLLSPNRLATTICSG